MLAGLGVLWVLYSNAKVSTVGKLKFANELRIPPLLEPRAAPGGERAFDLTLRPGSAELVPGRRTATWGINGAYLGPTLRVSRGESVRMNVRNQLGEDTTTLHWHGSHLPAGADGGPHQRIAPGATWAPGWRIDQPAATLWYHPHLHKATEEHVYRGLAGMLIVDDRNADGLALPRDYGVDDIPVMIQDKRFEDDGRLDFSQGTISPIGQLGDRILVNGTYDPHLDVRRERVRLRLLNASASRIYSIGLADGRPVKLIATEAGLLDAPRRLTRIPLAPAERAEIVATLRPGERVVLRSFEPELGTDFFNDRFAGGDDSFDLLELRAAARLAPSPAVPRRLVPLERPTATGPIRHIELSSSSTIDDRRMDLGRIDRAVRLGSREVWEVKNGTGVPHTFHPHGASFRVLEYDGRSPPAHLAGWKDNVLIGPNDDARLAVRFADYADRSLPFMFHCHLLQHEDRGMMGQFVILEPGERPGSPPPHPRDLGR